MRNLYTLLNYVIASVWFINGLLCKVLNLVPRHEEIVSYIVSENYSHFLTVVIGLLEILMAFWILSNYYSKINVITQIVIVVTMNILEFFLVPDLLLWGKLNLFFAIGFIIVVCTNEFYIKKRYV